MVAWLQKCTRILLPPRVLPSNLQLTLKALQIVLSAVQINTVEKNQVTSAQMWVLLLGQLVFLVWLLVLNKVQVSHVILCNNPTVNISKAHCMQAMHGNSAMGVSTCPSSSIHVACQQCSLQTCMHVSRRHCRHQQSSVRMLICHAVLQHGRWLRCNCV